MSVSEAEQRREARRQRILSNQEARLNKILGTNGVPSSEKISSRDESYPDRSGSKQEGTTSRMPSVTKNFSSNYVSSEETADYLPSSLTSILANTTAKWTTETDQEPSAIKLPSWKEGDGAKPLLSVPQERISIKQHHSILCLLSLISSLFGGPYLLVWLFIYEMTFVLMNGLTLPTFYTSNNSLFTVLALFGVPDVYRKRLGEVALILNWLVTDLTIFIASALTSVFLLYLI